MSVRPLLVIHAGHPKCGSTAVRCFLRRQGAALAQAGIYLLGNRFSLHDRNEIDDWPLWFVESAKGKPVSMLLDALLAGLENAAIHDVRALILSAENLSDPETAVALDGVIERFDTRLIYYMRRQDHFLVSSWRQWSMKRGLSLEEHVARRIAERRPSFAATLAHWEARIGRDRIHARFVDARFLDGGNLIADFAAALGVSGLSSAPCERANRSPDRAILLYLQTHPELFRSVHDDLPITRMVAYDSGPVMGLALSRHLQRTVRLAYESENQLLLQHYGRSGDAGLPVLLDDTPDDVLPAVLTERDRCRLDAILARLLECRGEISEPPSLRASHI